MSTEIKPFRIDIAQADLDDLADRLARTRFTDPAPGETGADEDSPYGVPVSRVRRLVERWRNGYDWRAWEARLNAYPQFTTEIDGQTIHFLHVKSPEPDALPLIVTHGWPGTVVEFLNVIGPLTDSRAHGADPAQAFDLVIPSLPGFAFSGPTTDGGWGTERTAKAWVELMHRLGYERYGAIGNDGGSMVSPEVGRHDPEHVVGVHVTQVFSFPSGDPAEFEGMSPEELEGMQVLKWFWEEKGAFNQLQSQQPQSLAHALADSPAGLLGWMAQLIDDAQGDDFIITNVALHWLTGTAGSAIRFYYENAHAGQQQAEPTTVPLGLGQAKSGDFVSIRRFADRDHKNIVSWNTIDAVGHYTAHSAPSAYSGDVRAFFAKLA